MISKKRLNLELPETKLDIDNPELTKDTPIVTLPVTSSPTTLLPKAKLLNNVTINTVLSELRDALRAGDQKIGFTNNGPVALRVVVAGYLDVDDIDSRYFNPQTLKRFEKLFAVPLDLVDGVKVWPSPDAVATALQNFINRRKNIWGGAYKSDPLQRETAAV